MPCMEGVGLTTGHARLGPEPAEPPERPATRIEERGRKPATSPVIGDFGVHPLRGARPGEGHGLRTGRGDTWRTIRDSSPPREPRRGSPRSRSRATRTGWSISTRPRSGRASRPRRHGLRRLAGDRGRCAGPDRSDEPPLPWHPRAGGTTPRALRVSPWTIPAGIATSVARLVLVAALFRRRPLLDVAEAPEPLFDVLVHRRRDGRLGSAGFRRLVGRHRPRRIPGEVRRIDERLDDVPVHVFRDR